MAHHPGELLAEPLLTVNDVARLLKVSTRTIWRYVVLQKVPEPIHINGNTVRWRAADIAEYLKSGGITRSAVPKRPKRPRRKPPKEPPS
jgi:predicted DNA-binding transcriptional regulator AlpA